MTHLEHADDILDALLRDLYVEHGLTLPLANIVTSLLRGAA